MKALREIIARPLIAGAVCSAFALLARLLGDEAARAFRWMVNLLVSWSDTLFALVTKSEAAADVVRSVEAWGAWTVYGLVTAAAAMLATRWLAGRALAWGSVATVLAVWVGIRVLVWNWDGDLRFALSPFRLGGPSVVWGPWPYAGSLGFFAGFAVGLVLAATPWRARGRSGG